MNLPDDTLERYHHSQGSHLIAGTDEVGMGSLAGPVVACAVILNLNNIPMGLNDSKLLTALKRESLNTAIQKSSITFSVAWSSVEEIDSINILQAARLAMKRAILGLTTQPDFILIDGRSSVDLPIRQLSIVQGDRKSVSIAAASILAKVFRDAWMANLDSEYPGYYFGKHKGYGSIEHRKQLALLGPSPIHRRTFSWTPPA